MAKPCRCPNCQTRFSLEDCPSSRVCPVCKKKGIVCVGDSAKSAPKRGKPKPKRKPGK